MPSSSSVRNLGVVFDSSLSMTSHISTICNISHIRRYLTTYACKSTRSRLCYCETGLRERATNWTTPLSVTLYQRTSTVPISNNDALLWGIRSVHKTRVKHEQTTGRHVAAGVFVTVTFCFLW